MPLVPFFALTVAATDLQGVKRKLFYVLLIVSVSLNFYILNLFVVPPLFSAFEYLHGRGWNSIVEYGGFNLLTQWCKFVRGSPLSATVAGLVSLLVVMTPLAVLFWLVRRERAGRSCRGEGGGREEDVVNATSLTSSAPA